MSQEDVVLTFLEGDAVQEHRDKMSHFLLSLNEERFTFALEEEQLLSSQAVMVAANSSGDWLGMAGWRPNWWGGVFFLVVRKDYQRLGIGKRLTLGLVAKVHHGMLLLLSVDRSNTRARKLYTDAGFHTLKRGKSHAFMVLGNRAYTLFGLPLKFAFLIRSLLGRC